MSFVSCFARRALLCVSLFDAFDKGKSQIGTTFKTVD
jgi:hypothetical protein